MYRERRVQQEEGFGGGRRRWSPAVAQSFGAGEAVSCCAFRVDRELFLHFISFVCAVLLTELCMLPVPQCDHELGWLENIAFGVVL